MRGVFDHLVQRLGVAVTAYEEAIAATSTPDAPWYVVPADSKWVTRAVVADVVATAIRGLDLRVPELTDDDRKRLDDARVRLTEE